MNLYNLYIFKELKYTTHKVSTFTYVFDALIKFFLEMAYWLLVVCDDIMIRKCHFIHKINDKTSNTMKNVKYYVNVGVKLQMPNLLHTV